MMGRKMVKTGDDANMHSFSKELFTVYTTDTLPIGTATSHYLYS